MWPQIWCWLFELWNSNQDLSAHPGALSLLPNTIPSRITCKLNYTGKSYFRAVSYMGGGGRANAGLPNRTDLTCPEKGLFLHKKSVLSHLPGCSEFQALVFSSTVLKQLDLHQFYFRIQVFYFRMGSPKLWYIHRMECNEAT